MALNLLNVASDRYCTLVRHRRSRQAVSSSKRTRLRWAFDRKF
jgi:hypothetical protein